MIDIVVLTVEDDIVIARRIRTEAEGRVKHPRVRWATVEELGFRPEVGEVFGITEACYRGCEVLP